MLYKSVLDAIYHGGAMVLRSKWYNNSTQEQPTTLTISDADGDIATVPLDEGRGQFAFEGVEQDLGGPVIVFSTEKDMSMLYKALAAYAADQLAFRKLKAWGDAQVNTIPDVRAGSVRFFGLDGIGPVQYEVIT